MRVRLASGERAISALSALLARHSYRDFTAPAPGRDAAHGWPVSGRITPSKRRRAVASKSSTRTNPNPDHENHADRDNQAEEACECAAPTLMGIRGFLPTSDRLAKGLLISRQGEPETRGRLAGGLVCRVSRTTIGAGCHGSLTK